MLLTVIWLDFVVEFWVEALFGVILSILTFFVRYLYNKQKKEKALLLKEKEEEKRKQEERIEKDRSEQALIKEALLALLFFRLRATGQELIEQEYATISDLDIIDHLYRSYHALGGNGTGTEIYTRCKKLPIHPPLDAESK